MPKLDATIHQPVRLQIMAALVALEPEDQVEFTYLRDMLELTDGNLGAHLRKLEDEHYINVTKTFVDRKPKTFIAVSALGRQKFEDHVAALQEIINGV